jgi:hypothetical protein
VSGRSGQISQQPDLGSNSPGARNPSCFGFVERVRGIAGSPEMEDDIRLDETFSGHRPSMSHLGYGRAAGKSSSWRIWNVHGPENRAETKRCSA